MAWRHVACSVAGTQHEHAGKPCEDASHASVLSLDEGGQLLMMFVADGAGSAARGGQGAQEAIRAAIDFARGHATDGFQPTEHAGLELLWCVHVRLRAMAIRECLPLSAFACTFQAVICSETGAVIVHVGDGAIIIDHGAGFVLATTPKNGDSVDQTHFVTEELAWSRLERESLPDYVHVQVIDGPIKRVASMTDGVTPLAIHYQTMTPHAPFFESMFATLEATTDEDQPELATHLAEFLRSPDVNKRTHDDKTLALAIPATQLP